MLSNYEKSKVEKEKRQKLYADNIEVLVRANARSCISGSARSSLRPLIKLPK
jgi:hypothetical protein